MHSFAVYDSQKTAIHYFRYQTTFAYRNDAYALTATKPLPSGHHITKMQGPTPPAGPPHPGSDGERVHVAEGVFRLIEGVSALAESIAAVTVAEAGEELAVGHLRQIHHEVFAVVGEEVVDVGGVLAGAEGAEIFIAVVAIRVHGFLLWSFDGGMRTRHCSLQPKVRGTPDKIRGYTARAEENTQKNIA